MGQTFSHGIWLFENVVTIKRHQNGLKPGWNCIFFGDIPRFSPILHDQQIG